MRKTARKTRLPKPARYTLKTEAPASMSHYKGNNTLCGWSTLDSIYHGWKNKPVVPYGEVISGYGTQYPYSVPHVSIMLDGASAYTVAALEEFVEPLQFPLPQKPW
jgi:hypothetical protein